MERTAIIPPLRKWRPDKAMLIQSGKRFKLGKVIRAGNAIRDVKSVVEGSVGIAEHGVTLPSRRLPKRPREI